MMPSPDTGKPSHSYLPTTPFYDRWATTYDTDDNPLQALDDHALLSLLPSFLVSLPHRPHLVDLGCGTGRNTLKLLGVPGATVVGLDASYGMRSIAHTRCLERWKQLDQGGRAELLRFDEFDLRGTAPVPSEARQADAVISTLVLEHVPLSAFFAALQQLVKPGGHVLLTNMHPDMGAKTQAGFVDAETGERVRGTSLIHTVQEVLDEARSHGFEIIGEVEERAVENEVQLGERAGKWVGIRCWFGGLWRRVG